jgi:hypothetical protein
MFQNVEQLISLLLCKPVMINWTMKFINKCCISKYSCNKLCFSLQKKLNIFKVIYSFLDGSAKDAFKCFCPTKGNNVKGRHSTGIKIHHWKILMRLFSGTLQEVIRCCNTVDGDVVVVVKERYKKALTI